MIPKFIATTAVLALALGTAQSAEKLAIDAEKSKVSFTILNKAPGAAEFGAVAGTFKEFKGSLVLDEAQPEKSSVVMEVMTTSVDTANERRDAHLRNQDFFKVKEFPVMKFMSKSVKKAGDSKYEVTGDFTLLDKTKEITVTFEKTGDRSGKTSFRIKRSEYGMGYRVPDTADEVDVTLEIVAAAK
jgi:polyisoprenoid-binding protein YceI